MFKLKTLEELKARTQELSLTLPVADDCSVLAQPVKIGDKVLENRIAIQPMEGCDGTANGSPDELTIRRYEKFAKSGAGLLWFEAVAVLQKARANPRQLWLHKETLDDFKRLVEQIRTLCVKENGFQPTIIMQATHSGRYSKPQGVPAPLIAYNNPIFEKDSPLPSSCIVSDDYLKALEEKMGEAALLAKQAGFDGVDIKSCHRYLGSELLSAYQRPGLYGGDFENRTRFLRNSIRNARQATGGDFLVATRLNVYDGYPYPYGFGVKADGGIEPDLTEGKKLVGILHQELGVKLIDITIGNPYSNPHVNRPADYQPYPVTEDPLEGVERMLNCVKEIQQAYLQLTVVGSGLSYPRQFAGNVAAGAIQENYFSIAGFGRMAFAYPGFAKDLLSTGKLDPQKCCITCGKCSLLMRYGSKAGCVVRDSLYTDLFREASKGKQPTV